jgi:hypothetical protein
MMQGNRHIAAAVARKCSKFFAAMGRGFVKALSHTHSVRGYPL